jgi:16S rRNA (cytosine967-C5)-methyltransferase
MLHAAVRHLGALTGATFSFNEAMIEEYAEKQKKIVQNVLRNLQKNAPLIYITCSVFTKENEENVKYFLKRWSYAETSTYIKGYGMGAGTYLYQGW